MGHEVTAQIAIPFGGTVLGQGTILRPILGTILRPLLGTILRPILGTVLIFVLVFFVFFSRRECK